MISWKVFYHQLKSIDTLLGSGEIVHCACSLIYVESIMLSALITLCVACSSISASDKVSISIISHHAVCASAVLRDS